VQPLSSGSAGREYRGAEGTDARRAGLPWRIVKAGLVCLLLVGSAALLSMEIASRSHPLLGWFTLLPLLAAIRVFPPRRALACGALWGGSLFLFLAARVDPLIPATIQSFALLSVVPGLFALLAVWVTRRFGFNPLILGFGWGAVELALLPLGLKGGLLGGTYGHEPGSLLHLLQGLFGYVCMAAFIVAVNGIALALLSRAYVGGCAARRYVHGSAKTEQRFFPLEVPINLLFYSNPAQPRAPPV